jgi:hypothetical protein
MKKSSLLLMLMLMLSTCLLAQTKKMYVYVETESSAVFEPGTFKWKAIVPYKSFVRFVSEIIDVAEPADYLRVQFYEHLVKNYGSDFKKMKLHKDYPRASVWDYNGNNANDVRQYKLFFEKDEKASWQYETILVKGFKYDAAKKTPGPLFTKAEKLLVKGIE